MTGRPTRYSADVASEICALIVEGEILSKICRREDMPGLRTVQGWFRDKPEFAELYDRARHDRAETWADLLVEITEDRSEDWIEKTRPDGSTYQAFNAEHVQRSKLRADNLKWLMSKASPKRYGEHLSVDSTSEVTVKEDLDLSHLTKRERESFGAIMTKIRAGAEKANRR